MIPKRIINCAIEGGWQPPDVSMSWQSIALDPAFWQALGKALRWGSIEIEGKKWKTGRDGYLNVWHSYAMDFYDLILTGGNTEKFWNEILPENK